VIEAPRRLVEEARAWLAEIASLRWARIGPINLAIPVAMAVVVVGFFDQLGRPIAGVPFGVLWILLTAAALSVLRVRSAVAPVGRSWLGLALVVQVVVAWLLFDILLWQQTNHLYDMDVYLASAGRWLSGGQPYMTGPISAWPQSAGQDFFLYPPPLLPIFGLLSRLPNQLVAIGWVGFLLACSYSSFRALGLRPIWSLLLLAFPPVMIGIESGNVASVTFLLFALGYRAGGSLVLDGLFKVQTGLPALWLVRTRRWRGLIVGLVAVAGIALLTLPIVGLDSWRAWLAGLGYRAESQPAVISLFGFSYARYMPGALFVAFAAAFVALALLFSGRRGLAALGLASIFASPSLWPHGFVFALPAVLMFESGTAVWLLLGAAAIGPNVWLLPYFGWVAVIAQRRLPDALHPMGGTDGPWPRPGALIQSRRDPWPGPWPGHGWATLGPDPGPVLAPPERCGSCSTPPGAMQCGTRGSLTDPRHRDSVLWR
jgi:hypothetical protein